MIFKEYEGYNLSWTHMYYTFSVFSYELSARYPNTTTVGITKVEIFFARDKNYMWKNHD